MTIIAVDGPAASGKGTIARTIAEWLGYAYLDTGALYRAVARDVLLAGGDLANEANAVAAARNLDLKTLPDPALRLPGAGNSASIVAQHSQVRRQLLSLQREFARQPPGAVLDGRDIGTVVCPQADVKLFITANAEVRAERRFLELIARGETVTQEGVLAEIKARDKRDSERSNAPLRPAEDALLLDTTTLDKIASIDTALELIARKIGQRNA